MISRSRLRPRRPRGGLWENADFLRLWSAQTIAQLGSQVTNLALPLAAILVLEASAFEVALVGTMTMLPFLLLTLPAGVWVDRLRRRPILIAADLGRAVALLSLPAAYAAGVLTLWQLYAVAFVHGALTVCFDVSYQSYLPALVGRRQLVDGNAKLEISRSGAQVAGPGVGGALVELVTAPFAILLDALALVGSALFLLRIRREEPVPEREPGSTRSMRRELVEGLRYVVRDPYIRGMAASTAWFNLGTSAVGAVLLVYAVRSLELTAGTIGVVFMLGNVGAIAAAVLARKLIGHFPVGKVIVLGSAGGAGMLLIPAAPQAFPIPFLVASQIVVAFGVVLYNTGAISVMQAITPDRLLGRMNASRRFVVWGVIPLGSLAGGALASAWGLREALWVGAGVTALGFLPLVLSPVRSLVDVPEGEDEEPPVALATPNPVTVPPPADA
ncbi:MAG TPA: MFS transporter [Gaiellaceae bacterium]|jgi:MFS family permease|nr:MFS transporter [Gaiellaceae bacterium]